MSLQIQIMRFLTADFIFPQMAHVSMTQAAVRMLYRGLAKERTGAQLRELMIVSMVLSRLWSLRMMLT